MACPVPQVISISCFHVYVVMHCYLDSRMVNAKQLQKFKSLGNALSQFSWMMTLYVSILQDSNLHCDIFNLLMKRIEVILASVFISDMSSLA